MVERGAMPRVYVQSKENASNIVFVDGKVVTALCRCGQSQNKPYCDGSHRACNFQAPASEVVLLE